MALNIVVTREIHADALKLIHPLGDLRVWTEDRPIPPRILEDWIVDATACLTMLTDRVDESLLAKASSLRIVSNMAVGYDNFDLKAATRRGVMMTNTPDVLTEATAELTWALILAVMRNVLPAHRDLLDGQWRTWSPTGFLGTELSGKTVGIVGFGRIGQAVGRRAQAFNMSVVVLSRGGGGDMNQIPRRLPLNEFLSTADVISLHMPLLPETRAMVDASWFSAMKPGTFLINTARGPLMDEKALMAALDRGIVAGAGLDVFSHEPVDGTHPLAAHPRVLSTPHIGSATHETRRAMALRAAENIRQALTGGIPRDLLNPQVCQK